MIRVLISKYLFLIFLILLIIVFFWKALFFNFVTDDFQHLFNSRIANWTDFINFLTFKHSLETSNYLFYRPLTTQFYYAASKQIFGLHPFFFHLIALIFHMLNTILVYNFAKNFTKGKFSPVLAAGIFGLNPGNVVAIGWAAAFQEIGVTFFILISSYSFMSYLKSKKNYFWFLSVITFLLALLSKEESIMIPFVLTLIVVLFGKTRQIIKLIPFYTLLLIYLYMHFVKYKFVPTDGYSLTFSFQTINNLRWYLWWSLGFPEVMTDFIGSRLTILPQLWINFPAIAVPVISLFSFVGFSLIIIAILSIRKSVRSLINKSVVVSLCFYLPFLLPVLFFTQRYAYRQIPSLIGLSLIIVILIENFYYLYKGKSIYLIVAIFLVLITLFKISVNINLDKNFIFLRSKHSEKTLESFKNKFPQVPYNAIIYVKNAPNYDTGNIWGTPSENAYKALHGEYAFKVYYGENISVYFEGINDLPKNIEKTRVIDFYVN